MHAVIYCTYVHVRYVRISMFHVPSSLRSTADQLGLSELFPDPPPPPPPPPCLTPSILGSCLCGPLNAMTTIWATLKLVRRDSRAPGFLLSGRPKSLMMGSMRSILALMVVEWALLRVMECILDAHRPRRPLTSGRRTMVANGQSRVDFAK